MGINGHIKFNQVGREPSGIIERRGEAIRSRAAGRGLAIDIVESLAVFGGGTSPEKYFPSAAQPGPSPTKTVPALQYTPRPNPPTPTLRPGQPTRLPSLPG